MTPRQETNMERSLGRLEAQVEAAIATLARVDKRSEARDEAFQEMRDDIALLKKHAQDMVVVTNEFNALQRAIRDGKMTGRGIIIGVGLAGGAVGATVATFLKTIWVALMGV